MTRDEEDALTRRGLILLAAIVLALALSVHWVRGEMRAELTAPTLKAR